VDQNKPNETETTGKSPVSDAAGLDEGQPSGTPDGTLPKSY